MADMASAVDLAKQLVEQVLELGALIVLLQGRPHAGVQLGVELAAKGAGALGLALGWGKILAGFDCSDELFDGLREVVDAPHASDVAHRLAQAGVDEGVVGVDARDLARASPQGGDGEAVAVVAVVVGELGGVVAVGAGDTREHPQAVLGEVGADDEVAELQAVPLAGEQAAVAPGGALVVIEGLVGGSLLLDFVEVLAWVVAPALAEGALLEVGEDGRGAGLVGADDGVLLGHG